MRESTQNHRAPRGRIVTAALTALFVVVLEIGAGLAMAAPASARNNHGQRVTHRWGHAINTRSLSSVNSAYWANYATNYSVPTNWLGNVLGCVTGQPSAESNQATLNSLNFVRSMAGLAPVTFSPTMNARAQQTALMLAANQALDHHPSRSWRCYSSTGAATAGRSNLALSYPSINSGQVVALYMKDSGGNNTAVGHRRWLLNPFTTTMGNGSTSTSNALTVVGPRSYYRPNPRYVSWPTAGYFPRPLEPAGRWSLSAGIRRTNFSKARVRVWRNGRRVPVRKMRVQNGYAMPTLVWQLPRYVPKTGTFRVSVNRIRIGRSKHNYRYAYSLRFFNPRH